MTCASIDDARVGRTRRADSIGGQKHSGRVGGIMFNDPVKMQRGITGLVASWAVVAVTAVVSPALAARDVSQDPSTEASAKTSRLIATGTITYEFDADALGALGLSVAARSDGADVEQGRVFRSEILAGSAIRSPGINSGVLMEGEETGMIRGIFDTRGAILLQRGEARIVVGNLLLQVGDGKEPPGVNAEALSWRVTDGLTEGAAGRVVFEVPSLVIDSPVGAGELRAAGELALSSILAEQLNFPQAAGTVIGRVLVDAKLSDVDRPTPGEGSAASPSDAGNGEGSTASAIGPDVIVGSLYQVSSYGSSGGISVFSVGTISCNVGDVWLNWFANNNQHPVIGQNMFRLKNGRFEQIGQSWLKHGFYALSNTLCNVGCQPTDGTHLGVHCSDPYSAALNGTQYNLGPKWQVDPHTGSFPYPPANPAYSGILARRLQVRNSDLDPAFGGGGQYIVEGHYVTPDDAAAGNQNNSASYRAITVSGGGNSWTINVAGTTQRMQPAIRAWQDNDPAVRETDIQVEGDGLLILAAKTTDLGGGWWHYEYAVQNLNSHRAVKSFSVPLDPSGTVANIGFHDVDYHSGEPFSGADWTATVANGWITWATQDYSFNASANALRWGTLYNFRFDIDRQPQTTTTTLALFRPGTPTSVSTHTVGPIISPADCNANGIPDSIDIFEGTSVDCDGNTVPDECQSYTPVAQQVATGLDRPVYVTAPPGDATRLFILEQAGRIRILSGGNLMATPFLDISSLVGSTDQNGLLSMAFDPNYAATGRFYVAHTDLTGDSLVARYNVSGNANIADANSRVILKTIGPASSIRSGGQIAFGPDGFLYVGAGDGGAANDPLNHGQDTGSLRGKILRLDVNNPPTYVPANNPFPDPGLPLDEIWSIGVRDPWRFSFDRKTGELYATDIGQNTQDEIDIRPASNTGGENYGWRCMEGTSCTGLSGCTCNSPALTLPTFSHTRSGGECRITGGYVYRGCALPNLLGTYFYADYCSGTIRSFRYSGGTVTDPQDWTADLTPSGGPLTQVVSFGEDAAGELYIVSYAGSIYKVVRGSSGGSTCGNGSVEPGEECDDGNTLPGDGCDAFCRNEPGPANDRCSNAFPAGEGAYAFDTAGAFTDGPDETVACQTDEFGGPVGSDIWYCYTASCSGTATVDLCASAYDTMAAVYNGCSCPTTPSATACNDNACFDKSAVTFPVTACRSYLIRVGGYYSAQGAGLMNVSCNPDPMVSDCNGNGVDDAVDIACGTVEDNNGNLVPDVCETDGDPIRGGRLYDRWWAQAGAPAPSSDHPLWTYRPDQTSNPAAGATTWRCTECHGWDYKGVGGLYGAGPHRTGFGGILGTTLSASDIFTLLREPPSNGGGPGVLNGHDYGSVLADPYLNDLVAFVLLGAIDDDDLIDAGTGAFFGDPQAGEINYTSGGMASQCISCHGPQGADINFGTVQVPEYLGTVAVYEPWVFLHRARMGYPGTPMQGFLANGGTDQGAADIGRYAQLNFPTDCIDGSRCDDGVACTVDECDAAGRCRHTANDAACTDDGVFCNGREACDVQLGCVSPGNPCGDPNACDEAGDGCGCAAPIVVAAGSRYLAITLQPIPTSVGIPTALRITPQCALGVAKYVGAPSGVPNIAMAVDNPADAARLTPVDWGGTVYVTGFDIAPEVNYVVEADCGLPDSPILTPAVAATTHRWGDVIDRNAPDAQTEPDGVVDFTDISALVDGFKGAASSLPLYRLDLFGCMPNQIIDFIDISGGVDAFRGHSYEGSSLCPGPCW